ncbi:MAG TPA: TIR domain-containing protein [Nitrospira sp.]|nr:TIR domain-containing protein [Nitrospira sp.]
MADNKIIFIAFAIEDIRQRDLFVGQTWHPRVPYEFTDMSVKEPYPTDEWKDRVRTRIRRSNGVIVLVSKHSKSSTGQKWEIQCAKEEKKPIRGIWAYTDDKTEIDGVATCSWSDDNISSFIDSV